MDLRIIGMKTNEGRKQDEGEFISNGEEEKDRGICKKI